MREINKAFQIFSFVDVEIESNTDVEFKKCLSLNL